MKTIQTDKAPKAIGPYSQAILAGGFFFVSGQLGLEPGSGNLIGDTAEMQAEQAMKNIETILETAGLNFEDVVDVTIFLTDLSDFGNINSIYGKFFENHKPARATVQVAALPKNGKVEIKVTACQKG
jgi:2-iminobutanoate/2-iminopropanoate deaminase